jgi:hypothetical protein
MENDIARFTSVCLAHVEREEAVLKSVRESLLQVRAALLCHDMAALKEALARQADEVLAAEELHHLRNTFREDTAKKLGLAPHAITLRLLAAHVAPEPGARLTHGRERLRRLSEEVDQLNRDNAVLVRHGLDFFRHLLSALTGGTPGGNGYDRAGAPRKAVCGSLLKARA